MVPEGRKGQKMVTHFIHKEARASHRNVQWPLAFGGGGHLGTSVIYGNTPTF